jgi:hypothetical protein
VGDIVKPAHKKKRAWTLILHPAEREETSKTGISDESIIVDGPFLWLGSVLELLTRGRAAGEQAFKVTYQGWARLYQAAGQHLKLNAFGPPVLYQLRHGGASHDQFHNHRALDVVKKRGRWLTDASVRRYEKGGRIPQLLARLTNEQREQADLLVDGIGKILFSAWIEKCAGGRMA